MIANRRSGGILIATNLIYDGKPSQRKFLRDKLKFGIRKPIGRKPCWMGDIEDGVSYFLCPDHPTWLPNQRYKITLEEKHQKQKEIAEGWCEGLLDGTYKNKANIANQNGCSRAWVTRLLKKELSFA